jgi:Ca2+-binding RTX toxin-like protein
MLRRLFASLVVALALATSVQPQGARAATTWIWPSGSCNSTLQACVTNALSGDTVLVAQNGLTAEQINITNKSLTLTAQTGFAPTLNAAVVQNSGMTGMPLVNVTISNIDFAHSVLISLSTGSGHTITLDHISAVSSGADPGVYGTIYVTSTVNVLHSDFPMGGFHPGIELTSPVAMDQALVYNVIGNTVSGHEVANAQTGIYLNATDAGSLTVNAYNNAVWDVGHATSSSTSGGFYLSSRDSGSADFNIVGNTVSRTSDGIKVNDEQDVEQGVTHRFSLDLFDNIVVGSAESAVDVSADEPGTLFIRGGHNDFSSNGQPNQTLGHSLGTNLTAAPKFVDAAHGNLALQATSPVIDKGLTCTPGGVAGPDAAGNDRLAGATVDIGAYEFNAGAPGFVMVGGTGPDTFIGGPHPDILCGYAGADTLFGTNAGDFVDGGKGNDKLYGGPGKDRLIGESGNDLLCANDGAGGDHLDGGKGTDSYRADPGDVKVSVEHLGNCTI